MRLRHRLDTSVFRLPDRLQKCQQEMGLSGGFSLASKPLGPSPVLRTAAEHAEGELHVLDNTAGRKAGT